MKRKLLRKAVSLTSVVVALFTVCMFFGTILSSAHEKNNPEETVYKYYTSIRIEYGDTLWDIAKETMTDEYNSTAEYVEVLKKMNSLDSDDIQAGQYLIVAYNDTEFK